MKRKFLLCGTLMAFLLSGFVFTSCNDDDDDDDSDYSRTITFENLMSEKDFVQSGTFQSGTATAPTAILPGQQVEIKFNAGKGQVLSFATMYGNSKDLFFAPANPGIMLFESNGTPVTGDVSAQVKLWDNGTKLNSDPTQAAEGQPNTVEDKNIAEVAGTDGTHTYPAANDMMKLMLAYNANTSEFTLTIKNNSDQTAVQTPFSPGVWVVSSLNSSNQPVNAAPFYTAGQKTTSQLTALATSGNGQSLTELNQGKTGIVSGISPVLMVVYTGDTNPIFTVNQKDAGLGLKELSQTGDLTKLKNALERERVVSRVYQFGTAAAGPGSKIEGTYEARSYEKIAFVTMFGASNDWFFANNTPIDALSTGDKTSMVSLYDNGTAWSQYPGAGNAQVGFGGTAIAEDEVIKLVNNLTYPTFDVPEVNQMLKVTIK